MTKISTGLKKGSADISLLRELERQAPVGGKQARGGAAATAAGMAVLDKGNNYTPPWDCIQRSDFLLPDTGEGMEKIL